MTKRMNSDAIMARVLPYTLLKVALRKCFFLSLVQFPLRNGGPLHTSVLEGDLEITAACSDPFSSDYTFLHSSS